MATPPRDPGTPTVGVYDRPDHSGRRNLIIAAGVLLTLVSTVLSLYFFDVIG